jgi:hypothetical protein
MSTKMRRFLRLSTVATWSRCPPPLPPPFPSPSPPSPPSPRLPLPPVEGVQKFTPTPGFPNPLRRTYVTFALTVLKVDACAATIPAETLMTRWRDELNKTGRPVLFSNCHNGCETQKGEPLPSWCAELSNMWRTSSDINSHWSGVMHNLNTLRGRGKYGAPGRWNDPGACCWWLVASHDQSVIFLHRRLPGARQRRVLMW